jgi:starch synthase (maltosyl-transferring)
VLYLTPIHPIGQTNRKGRNNALTSGVSDPGSPYAIGSSEGGHDAIHPELGTLDDFRALTAAARSQGMELALDIAVQMSPDHPWITQHPTWFKRRPDGSMKYAENPPKKYEDIVIPDFYADPALWVALRDIFLFWVSEGVRIFRVDNPHTKPLPLWAWLISEVKTSHPDVIFLAEAFTRPGLMYHLAKLGFTESYTYFTWRNTKAELTAYLTELSQTDVREYFRPHFFVNTPDINPYFLQSAGRAGFLIRAALAATTSGLWGMYSGFELCENAALPGREEYLDSEKYELKGRDYDRSGNITREITQLNALRNGEPVFRSHFGIAFLNAFNDNILYFSKTGADGAYRVLVAINLDPHQTQACSFEVPLWEWDLPDHETLLVEDLVNGDSFSWSGKVQHMALSQDRPYAIWRVRPVKGARS